MVLHDQDGVNHHRLAQVETEDEHVVLRSQLHIRGDEARFELRGSRAHVINDRAVDVARRPDGEICDQVLGSFRR